MRRLPLRMFTTSDMAPAERCNFPPFVTPLLLRACRVSPLSLLRTRWPALCLWMPRHGALQVSADAQMMYNDAVIYVVPALIGASVVCVLTGVLAAAGTLSLQEPWPAQ